MLRISSISKSFDGRPVVRDVSLAIRPGEVVGLLGRNGAGKTTVFSMVAGLTAADSGQVLLDGLDITAEPLFRRARHGIVYLPQQPSVFRGLTVEQNIMLVLEMHEADRGARRERLEALLDALRMEPLRAVKAGKLSGGERRRCEIARLLAGNPSFVLLDEPFAGVDPLVVTQVRVLMRYIAGLGIGVLITDHNVRETLALVDRAYIIDSGRVLMHGTADEVLNSPDVRRAYLGEDFRL